MQSSPVGCLGEENLLKKGCGTGKYTGVHLPYIDANHLIQLLGGSGQRKKRNGGGWQPNSGSNSMITGTMTLPVPGSLTGSPTS
jgi:hypothetical protein